MGKNGLYILLAVLVIMLIVFLVVAFVFGASILSNWYLAVGTDDNLEKSEDIKESGIKLNSDYSKLWFGNW